MHVEIRALQGVRSDCESFHVTKDRACRAGISVTSARHVRLIALFGGP